MKKLVLLFLVLLAVVLVVGCNARRNKGEFAENETTTVVTSAEEGASEPLNVTDTAKPTSSGALAVTSPAGGTLETAKAYHAVRGTAPANAHRIQVNDYTLTKYRPGQTQWSYIASTRFGTLKAGENTYVVRALDQAGNEIATTNFSVTYTAPIATALPGTGSPLWSALAMSLLFAMGWFGLKRFTPNKNY